MQSCMDNQKSGLVPRPSGVCGSGNEAMAGHARAYMGTRYSNEQKCTVSSVLD